MKVLAGTTRGVYSINGHDPRRVLESRGVRDLVNVDGRLFAGTGAGLYSSDDEGESWAMVGMVDRQVWQTRAATDDVMYATTQPAGLFRSDDGGTTWNEVASFADIPEYDDWCVPIEPPEPGRARALVIDRDDPERIWVGVEVGGIARTTDGGDSWSVSLPGDNPDLHMMYAHPSEVGVMFASTGYGRYDGEAEMVEPNAGVFRSDDYGETWSYAWKGVTPRYSRPMCIDDRAPHGLTVAAAPDAFSNFKQENGVGAMLFRSDDRGDSWRSLCDTAHSPSAANIHGLTTDPETTGGVLVGTDTGEVWRVSAEAHWTEVATGMPAVLTIATI